MKQKGKRKEKQKEKEVKFQHWTYDFYITQEVQVLWWLYIEWGSSMRAAKAKAASFSAWFAFFAMIAVKLTNCIVIQSLRTIEVVS